jgi:hypothetical protein
VIDVEDVFEEHFEKVTTNPKNPQLKEIIFETQMHLIKMCSFTALISPTGKINLIL